MTFLTGKQAGDLQEHVPKPLGRHCWAGLLTSGMDSPTRNRGADLFSIMQHIVSSIVLREIHITVRPFIDQAYFVVHTGLLDLASNYDNSVPMMVVLGFYCIH